MNSDTQRYGEQPGFILDPFIACLFWMLAVTVLLNLFGLDLGMSYKPAYGVSSVLVVVGCLIVAGLAHVRPSQALGIPGSLIAATVVSHLLIGLVVAAASGGEIRLLPVVLETGFLVVLVGATLGGRAVLERAGVDAFLKSVLTILAASCILVLATPILSHFGAKLPVPSRQVYYSAGYIVNFPGTFDTYNEAGFVGSLTTVLALAFLHNTRQDRKSVV